jgi:hypothetical protein
MTTSDSVRKTVWLAELPSRAETKEQKKPIKSPCLTREVEAPKKGLECGKTQSKQDLNTRKRRDIRELRNEKSRKIRR